MAHTLFQHILDWLLPHRCVVCGSTGYALCPTCISSFPRAEMVPHPNVRALFSYRHPSVKRAILALKFNGVRGVAAPLGEALSDLVLEDIADIRSVDTISPIIMVPIPLSSSRKRERGYNQSTCIVSALASRLDTTCGVSVQEVLTRTRETPPQSSLQQKSARVVNVRNCFATVENLPIEGAHVIVVDDVVTTGATLNEAISVLKRSGVRSVRAYAVAH